MEDPICQFSGILTDFEELQIDGAATTVGMAKLNDSRANQCVDTEFLVQFTLQGLLWALTGFNLPTRKLPFESHWLIGSPLADKNLVSTEDQRCYNKANLLVADGEFGMCSIASHLPILDASFRKENLSPT